MHTHTRARTHTHTHTRMHAHTHPHSNRHTHTNPDQQVNLINAGSILLLYNVYRIHIVTDIMKYTIKEKQTDESLIFFQVTRKKRNTDESLKTLTL